jgi:pSer/pThr/pTyr-binding forkhead associated (FHA) protein
MSAAVGAIDAEEALLALKIGFLVLLYLFIWAVVRSATRDLHTVPQESIVIGAAEADVLRAHYQKGAEATAARLLVLASPALGAGSTLQLTVSTRLGRGGENAVQLDGDDFVSSRHAVLEPRAGGLWVEDIGSTNGTFVNGARVTTARLLRTGDVVRIGQTELRLES